MGGSIEFRGRMRLSKVIFQMSIYIATFIIATIGSDYMYQVFILDQELPQIRTMRDLANSNIDFVMEESAYQLWKRVLSNIMKSDSTLQRIFDRVTETRALLDTELTYFCNARSRGDPIGDESVNLCLYGKEYEFTIVTPDERLQIDRIQDPITLDRDILTLGKYPFFKYRLEEIILKMFEAGLYKKWRKDDEDDYRRFLKLDKAHFHEGKNAEVPLEEQLWPILAIGFSVGIVVLIGEIFWKRVIARTELGKLITAYYNNSHASSARFPVRAFEIRHLSRNMLEKGESMSNRLNRVDQPRIGLTRTMSHP
ncbi:hypothetical protein QAD02_010882 [Eretmocerus hayati]|uniref:Uncharacterized protein n=1 Tax=Eretmocerus hayati TaxID=131215 RepID=A0ACC2NVB9_9HYME|nr:hypothetical protein QAD02_010882 [Eretmocerus hayati]